MLVKALVNRNEIRLIFCTRGSTSIASVRTFWNQLSDKWCNFASKGVSPDVEGICEELGMVSEPLEVSHE
jgi:hypothetical protein